MVATKWLVYASNTRTIVPPRVLVTRSPHQASALAEALRARGAEPVLIPAVEMAPPASYEALDATVDDVISADETRCPDWLVFTSVNGVEAFFARLAQREGAAARPAGLRLAAVGSATARALEAAGWPVEVVPERAVSEALAEALLPYARRTDGSPARFRVVRAEQGREVLVDALRQAGADVAVVPAYRTVAPAESVAALRVLFGEGSQGVEAVTFTSSSSVRNLLDLCSAAGVELPREVVRASIGPVTSATLREAGYAPDVEAEMATVESLADVLMVKLGLR